MQTILNVAGNAVKFAKEGHVSITASVAKPDFSKDPQTASDEHFYLFVQVSCQKNFLVLISSNPLVALIC